MHGRLIIFFSIVVFIVLGMFIFVGNITKPPPSPIILTNVVVYAGLGIPDVAEIGMSYRELKRLMRNVFWVKDNGGKNIEMPEIGAYAPLHVHESTRSPITLLCFSVSSNSAPRIDGSVFPVFTGSIERRLHFDKPIFVEDVEQAFGELPLFQAPASLADIFKHRGVKLASDSNVFEIAYFDKGISFRIESNKVTSFSIFIPHLKQEE